MSAAIATVIAALAAALVAFAGERYARRTERVSQAKEVFDAHRGPLRSAAWALGDRIDNIRDRDFWKFVAEGNPRREQAKASTAFRVERYFDRCLTLREQVQVLNSAPARTTVC
jgi:hypothetical protein